jgi:beta-galactosidase
MKFIIFLFCLFFCISISNAQRKSAVDQSSPRIEKIINSQWTFNYFPYESAKEGYESPGFNDSKWPAVSIPHTWLTYETTGELHPFIRNASESDNPYWWIGWGWYRKHFSVNPGYAGKKIFIEFEGVQKYCRVWLNGKYLGDHKGGYGSFDFDITDLVKPGEDNVLAVAVNNLRNDEFKIPPMAAGNFNVYGGIYRDVTVVLKNRLYIPMQGSASHEGGTFITTPQVSERDGVVRVQTWVKNDHKEKKKCTLVTSVADASGKIVQEIKTDAEITPGELYKFDQTSKPVRNPHLWSNEDPYMYSVHSTVMDGREIADTYTSPLGFRWFRWDYKENFLYVNGKKVLIHGGNRHQEYPWLGDAIPKWITEMDYRDIAENLNYNFMRTAHYPNDKLVYELADKYGIVIDEETPSIKNQDFSVEVQEQQMKEMIRRDRNHPGIMFWSMGNETNHAVDSKFAVAEDTTRIITARRVTDGSAGQFVTHTDDNLAIENLLRCTIRGWYNKDVKDLEPLDQQQCGTEEHQQNMLMASGLFGKANLCTWLYEDHGADREYLNSPMLHVNPKGYVDVYRVPKYAYYFWQASYYEKPMVFIQPHFWRSQYIGQKKDLVVNSNCDRVELMVNGVSKGFQTPDEDIYHSVTFKDITVENGKVSAVGTKNGQTVTTQVVLAGEPAKIILSSSHQKIDADRGSVAIITADIVDSQGNHVYGASNSVRWTVTGPASLVGPAIYESDINKHHEMEGVWYMDMPVSNVIRSAGQPGNIHIMASASGLVSGSLEILAADVPQDNSAISEPVLDDEGRRPVTRIIMTVNRLEEAPQEIKKTYDEIKLTRSDRQGYARQIREYIIKNNPEQDSTTTEFRALVDLFAEYLSNNNGTLIADDFNFNTDHYNNCRLISGYIASTRLPQLFKDGLRKYYADAIIREGSEKNAGEEMNWLNWIPSGGTVIIYEASPGSAPVKGVKVTSNNRLTDMIAEVYPVFNGFSDVARERALIFISKMNPYIKVSSLSEQSREGNKEMVTTVSYLADEGKPILIPELKFISE